jgi:hypothetical protein
MFENKLFCEYTTTPEKTMRIRFVAVLALNALLLAALNSYAAGGGGVGGGGPPSINPSPPSAPAAGGRYPIGAPPSNDATDAYQFRSRMSQEPQCQALSQEADRIFMDSALQAEQKAQQLKQVEARAKQQKCLQSQAY